MLSALRVVDLTDHRGLLCGQILGDLGADVIHVEPPGGSPARRLGPFHGDVVHPDRSLFWWAFTRNQRSVTLDVAHPPGREALARLLETADFLVDSAPPGTLADAGLDPATVAATHPRLVHVSITAFGQTGPKAGWAGADIVLLAAGGPLILTGDADRPPVRLPVPQAWLHAGADAAVGAMIAHHARMRSGHGQHVDVSAQQSVALATQSYILAAAFDAPEVQRAAGGLTMGAVSVRLLFPAKDGHVAITFLFGSAIGPFSRRLMEWIHEEGGCDAATRDKDWLRYSQLLLSDEEPLAEFERVKAVIAAFTAARPKAELLAAALARGLLIAPVSTLGEVLASPQLAAREYWQPLDHPELGTTVRYPGAFARFEASPLRWRRRPPRVGEHTDEVLGGELGLDVATLRARGAV
ncbi:MAG: CoA transferase [bacterium]|nr:CoA transferase [bacterium]